MEPDTPAGGPEPLRVNPEPSIAVNAPGGAGENGARPEPPPAPTAEGPTTSSPWVVELSTVQAMIDAEAARQAKIVLLATACSIATLLIVIRAHRALGQLAQRVAALELPEA